MMLAASFFLVHAWAGTVLPVDVFDGHGDDVGKLEPGSQIPQSDQPGVGACDFTALVHMHVGPAIREIKANYTNLCATLKRSVMGGLTIGNINAPMEYSLFRNFTWVMPEIRPPSHHCDDQFVHLFGQQPEVANAEKALPLWEARCYTESQNNVGFDGLRCWFGWRCHRKVMEVRETPDNIISTYCGCDAFVEFHGSSWHSYYAVTGPVLSKLYWKDRGYPDFKLPLDVVHHMRLGDAKGRTDGFVNGTVMSELVGAFAEASQMDHRCLRVSVMTDGYLHDEHVLVVRDAWTDTVGIGWTDVFDNDDPVSKSMDFMARADIFIGGPQFAAVVTKARVKVFYENPEMDHPIDCLSGATVIPNGSDKEHMKKMMTNNNELKALARECQDWLSK